MHEILKAAEVSRRGGCWFESGSAQVHLGVAAGFRPTKKAHPAFRCSEYDALLSRLIAAGIRIDEPNDVPHVRPSYSRPIR